MTSKELVYQTLEFRNESGKVPRQVNWLPWAEYNYPQELKQIINDFPGDIGHPGAPLKEHPKTKGHVFEAGEFVDQWGCIFENIHPGVQGEVKTPLVQDGDWADVNRIHIPVEFLTFDIDEANRSCEQLQDKFLFSGSCPRPFEQLQFIRGTENLYMDLMDPPKGLLEFMKRMHDFYCQWTLKWAKTDVDMILFMDDWGAQNDLLIHPDIWCDLFKPMYKDYIDIARSYGKKTFMHSDGHILRIIPHLIELGLDAVNSQIFCMGIENLEQFAGKITFWGEIDRQHLLPKGTLADIDAAVDQVYGKLWKNGGCVAHCEFGPGAKPENVYRVYERWGQKGSDIN